MKQVDIKDFENYQITDDGRVWSKNSNRFLSLNKGKNGYYLANLWKNNKNYTKSVHRLVAEAFIPNPDNKPCVDHIKPVSEGGTNNVENLRWTTEKENSNNSKTLEHNSFSHKGEKHNNYGKHLSVATKDKIADSQSKQVCQYTLDDKLVKIWKSTKECGENGFNQGHVAECCRGERNKHKNYKWKYC